MNKKETLNKLNTNVLVDSVYKQAELVGYYTSENEEKELTEQEFKSKIQYWANAKGYKKRIIDTFIVLSNKIKVKLEDNKRAEEMLENVMLMTKTKTLDELILFMNHLLKRKDNDEDQVNHDIEDVNSEVKDKNFFGGAAMLGVKQVQFKDVDVIIHSNLDSESGDLWGAGDHEIGSRSHNNTGYLEDAYETNLHSGGLDINDTFMSKLTTVSKVSDPVDEDTSSNEEPVESDIGGQQPNGQQQNGKEGLITGDPKADGGGGHKANNGQVVKNGQGESIVDKGQLVEDLISKDRKLVPKGGKYTSSYSNLTSNINNTTDQWPKLNSLITTQTKSLWDQTYDKQNPYNNDQAKSSGSRVSTNFSGGAIYSNVPFTDYSLYGSTGLSNISNQNDGFGYNEVNKSPLKNNNSNGTFGGSNFPGGNGGFPGGGPPNGNGNRDNDRKKNDQNKKRDEEVKSQLDKLSELADKLSLNKKPELNNRFKMEKNLPKFSGTGSAESFDEWIFMIESFQELNHVSNEEMMAVVLPLLRGHALQILKRIKLNQDELSWSILKEELNKTYITDTRERRLRKELKELKQGKNFDEYLMKFREITNQLVDVPQTELTRSFIDGLKPKARYECIMKGADKLLDAMRIARIFEECHESASKKEDGFKKINYSKTEFPKKWRKRFDKNKAKFKTGGRFVKPNYKVNQEKTKDNFSSKDLEKIICYKCNKSGHIARNCRTAKKNKEKTTKINQVVVQNCPDNEQKGYIAVNAAHTNNDIKLPGITGYVNGIKMTLAFDSGATASIMSYSTAIKNKIIIKETNLKVKLANDMVRDVYGITSKLTVDVAGITCDEEFIIIDHADHDVLLGLPWFCQTGAALRPKDNVLMFGQRKVLLNPNQLLYDEDTDVVDVFSSVIDEYEDDELGWRGCKGEDNRATIVKPEIKLNNHQLNKFYNVMKEMIKLFAFDLSDLSTCTTGEHIIRTLNCPPVFTPPFRKAHKEKELMQEEVNQMLKLGIIEESISPWNSPAIIIPKKDGSRRFVIDYRNVNTVIQDDRWPLPRIEDILDRLSGAKYFSVLDLTSGYWQIPLATESRPITAFSTDVSHYQFTRLPFGLKTAPAAFSRIMQQVLGNRPYVEIYLDDITIYSKSFDEHIEHIKLVANALKQANLKIKPSKCKWVCNKINILGHVVSGGTVAMDLDKIKAIEQRVPPKTLKQLQQFLGLCNYYRKFIKDYSIIATPLTKLLRADAKFVWLDEQAEAFNKLKLALTSYPVLRQPDFSQQFLIYTDASYNCLGAILAQKDSDGKDYVCAYASRTLKDNEINYTTSEKECLAVVWAIKKFRVYL